MSSGLGMSWMGDSMGDNGAVSTGQRRAIAATIATIDAASDEAALRAAVTSTYAAIRDELAAHTPAEALAADWSEVLAHGVAAAVRLIDSPLEWTWLVSGSAARGEAAPGSDIETLIVCSDATDEDVHRRVLAQAADVHALLERCGLPGDANGVLGSRPRFCRPMSGWLAGMQMWAAHPERDRGVVMTGILADSMALTAPPDLLRAPTVAAVGSQYPIRQALLADATTLRAGFPSRLRMFTTAHDTVDLKAAAIDPVVKIARWAGMSAGSTELSTLRRLDAAAGAGVLDADDVTSLRESHQWLMRFRWRHRVGRWLRGERVDDVVALSATAPQERAALRSVAREVAGVSRKLTYLASTQAFR